MPVLRHVATAVVFALLAAIALIAPSTAADAQTRACLGRDEQRAAVAANKAIPLAEALRMLRARGTRGEAVRASLCRRDGKLVYVLTLLARKWQSEPRDGRRRQRRDHRRPLSKPAVFS